MNTDTFFYRLHLLGPDGNPTAFLGTAFPVAPNGGLLTCRHVVSGLIPAGSSIAVFDNESDCFTRLTVAPVYSSDSRLDLAYLPHALARSKTKFIPILAPEKLLIGENVYSFGYFAIGGDQSAIERGYFSGKIVNFFDYESSVDLSSFTLPFPVLEGMSGSPVLTYHNGPKLVGIAIGNRISRILASETIEYRDEKQEFKESVNRIVEFGVSYHCASIAAFLGFAGAHGFIVSSDLVPNLGLENG